MLEHMLTPLMPNAKELVERDPPWLFDDDSAADLALLQAVGVLGSMRESELALFFRGALERDGHVTDHADDFAVRYPSSNGHSLVTCESAVHATRRRLLALVKAKLLATDKVQRTTADNLAGWFYWLTRKGTRHLIDAGYRVRGRQTIHNMAHIGSVQDQHRLLEQQYLIARRLIDPNLRVWGEYAIRSRLARDPVRAAPGTNLPTVKARLEEMSAQLFLTPEHLGDQPTPNTEENRRYFTRRPDALLFDEQPEVRKVLEAIRGNPESQPRLPLGDVEFCEVESSKKDATTQAKSFNGLFYLGFFMDGTLERGRVARVMLVTRNHPHTDLRAKLLTAYERWLERQDVQAMLRKKANLTPGFKPEGLNEHLWLAELTQDSEQRLTGLQMESVASIFLRERRVGC